jgi:hypothetical protein
VRPREICKIWPIRATVSHKVHIDEALEVRSWLRTNSHVRRVVWNMIERQQFTNAGCATEASVAIASTRTDIVSPAKRRSDETAEEWSDQE